MCSLNASPSIELVLVEEGSFYMGNENTYLDEKPRHPVHLDGYFIEKKEVSIRDWFYVHDWAIENGYDFSENQSFPLMVYTLDQEKEYTDFPMNNVSWLDCLKWCNARSELMGRKPVYYTDSSLEDVFREGEFHHFTKSQIDFQEADSDCRLKGVKKLLRYSQEFSAKLSLGKSIEWYFQT